MESSNADFLQFSIKNHQKLYFEQLARNSSLIGDNSEVFSKFTKFPVAIVSEGGGKAFICISRYYMINELRNSLGETPSL